MKTEKLYVALIANHLVLIKTFTHFHYKQMVIKNTALIPNASPNITAMTQFVTVTISHAPNCNSGYTHVTLTTETASDNTARSISYLVFAEITDSVTLSPTIYRYNFLGRHQCGLKKLK